MPRVLYIHPGTFGPEIEPRKNPFHYLSRHLSGDYVTTWVADDAGAADGWAERCRGALGHFTVHWTRSLHLPNGLQQLWDVMFFIRRGLSLTRRRGRFAAVVAYGPHRTGVAGYIIARLTRSVFILELPGNPLKPYQFVNEGLVSRVKRAVSPRLVAYLVERADHLWLRYPGQLDGLVPRSPDQVSVFANFVPIHAISPVPIVPEQENAGRYVLFIGHPWYLKGVDVLIRAFLRIADEFPEYRLRIVGHCPDRSYFEQLRAGHERIEFIRPVPHPEAMRLIEGCSLFVLPSRTDAMARVLLEAMAAAKPVVASDVDGNPHLIRHGETGLLFRSEDPVDLAAQMENVLSDRALARRLGLRAHQHVHEHRSEEQYALRFREMVDRATTGPHGTTV